MHVHILATFGTYVQTVDSTLMVVVFDHAKHGHNARMQRADALVGIFFGVGS